MTTRFFPGGYPLEKRGRVLCLTWGLLLCCGFLLARWLEPNPQGFGTHQQLGLPPCTFLTLTGLPCPSCGMTTCFAHFTRGHWRQAVAASPPGVLLATVCAGLVPWCLASAGRGTLIGVSQPSTVGMAGMLVIAGICIAYWLVQIFSGRL